MLFLFVRGLALIVLFFSASVSPAEIINWGVTAGECTDQDITAINGWLADANALLGAALRAVREKKTGNEDVLAFFTAYFGIRWDYDTPGAFQEGPSEGIFADVWSTLADMSTFMASGQLTVDAAGGPSARQKAPYGYCGVGNYQLTEWESVARFPDGLPVPNLVPGEPPYSVKDIFGQAFSPGLFTPYLAITENAYIFDSLAAPLCSIEQDEDKNTVVTLAFVARPNKATFLPLENVELANLFGPSINICDTMLNGENLPDTVVESLADLSKAYPTKDAPTRLDAKIPKGAIIFHELTHLTTDYVKDNWYPLDSCIKHAVNDPTLGKISAQTNANSYMFFALAAWYYYNPPGDYVATFYRGTSDDEVHMI